MKRDDWDAILKGEGPVAPPERAPAPASEPRYQAPRAAGRKWPARVAIIIGAAALLLGLYSAYVLRGANQQLALVNKRLEDSDTRLAELQSILTVTQERIGVTRRDLDRARSLAVRLKAEQERNVEALKQELGQKADTAQVAAVQQEATTKLGALSTDLSSVKGEVSEAKTGLESNRQELEKTKQDVASLNVLINDQGKAIALNSAGLDELRRKGERDYVEFTLAKKDKIRQVADVRLELRGADVKKQRSDLRVYANDARLDKNKVVVNEPVYFRQGKDNVLYELVINEVRKDQVVGYLSVPKHRALVASGPKHGSTP